MPHNALSAAAKAALLLALTLVGTPATAQTYTARDLGTLPGTDASYGVDVNDRGEVVGETSYRAHYRNSFYWSASTGMVDMGVYAVDGPRINNLGHVLINGTQVWRYGENGNLPAVLIGLRPGGRVSANDINDNGEIGGYSDTNDIIGYDSAGSPQYAIAPTIWKQVGGQWTPTPLPLPVADNRGFMWQLTSEAADGSERAMGYCGQVAYDAAGNYTIVARHVTRWTRTAGVWTITAVGGDLAPNESAFAPYVMNAAGDAAEPGAFAARDTCTPVPAGMNPHGIDDAGNLGGTASLPEGTRATRRDCATGLIASLGTLGGMQSWAEDPWGNNSYRAMNASGAIVGFSEIAGSTDWHAFIWSSATHMRDLDAPSVTTNKGGLLMLRCASAIANTGCIVGTGTRKKGLATRAFLLTPN